ncbi:uncharacterized protein LOC110465201 [Mizuhopecten yessoensis]|uniref:uncharacterized protein LOC110465201 n=1 Tax=Mizuhopecten yessoensis TaxID=6573 RepID=UPI000B45C841|nr:uncharacterized protein LOC110465201 [Mizuhopecten yessoensis]
MDGVTWTMVKSPDGSPNLFVGSHDRNTPMTSEVTPHILARHLRINPQSWQGRVTLRFDVSGCQIKKQNEQDYRFYVSGVYSSSVWRYSGGTDVLNSALWSHNNPDPSEGHCVLLTQTDILICSDFLVSGLHGVNDTALSASSYIEDTLDCSPRNARLFYPGDVLSTLKRLGGWQSGIANTDQFIQVTFSVDTIIRAVTVQGRFEQFDEWVTTYYLLYSMDGVTWTMVKSPDGAPNLFVGSHDRNTPITSEVTPNVTTRHLRINPQSWQSRVTLRFDVSGCQIKKQNDILDMYGYKEDQGAAMLYNIIEVRNNQTDASTTCTRQYTQLMRVDTTSKLTSLHNTINRYRVLEQDYRFYVSGVYSSHVWRYSGGTDVLNSAFWPPGNPDPTEGHCVMLTLTGLTSVDCQQNLYSICGI